MDHKAEIRFKKIWAICDIQLISGLFLPAQIKGKGEVRMVNILSHEIKDELYLTAMNLTRDLVNDLPYSH